MGEKRSVYCARPGQVMGGHAVGILLLEVGYPILPGNVANASSFSFPVRYKVVKGATIERLCYEADPGLVEPLVSSARELERDGVKAIVGACGYFGMFQREMAEALAVPVFMSSLLQAPLLARSLKRGQKVGILCADSGALSPKVLESCGVDGSVPFVAKGLENFPEFRSAITEGKGTLDDRRVEKEVVQAARELIEGNPDIGVMLLECSDMPPYAKAVQDATGLPVWDFNTMINWIYYAVVQREYDGFI